MTNTFADLGVAPELCAALAARGLTEPFPIQAATLPDALAGRDICGGAPTGSGKTLAFGLPLVTGLDQARPRWPTALVLAPTRELASQIREEIEQLGRVVGRRTAAVYGGVGYGGQKAALARGVDVLVACPGRLEDLIQQGAVHLGEVTRVVVDEADRMADMGFLPAVRRLLDATATDRQTSLFSATLDSAVSGLGVRYQRHAAHHEVSSMEADGDVRHEVRRVSREERVSTTAEIIRDNPSTIVFCRTRRGVDRLVKHLARLGVDGAPIHGGRSQGQRDRALDAFTRGRARALVATDVAARGIHVDGVSCVVHYDVAPDRDTYLHRSGRTGRAGADGVVVTLAADAQQHTEAVALLDKMNLKVGARTSSKPKAAARAPRAPRQVASPEVPTTPARSPRRSDGSRLKGRVKFFDHQRGFGFITHADRGDVFFHHSQVTGDARPVRDGQHVLFEIGRGRNGDEARKVVAA